MRLIRVFGLVALAVTLAACGVGQTLPATTQTGAPVTPQQRLPVTDPPSFAFVNMGATGLSWTVELRSPTTGQVVKVLATFGQSFTNNGFAMSPDGKYVYVTLIGRSSLLMERISVTTRKRTFVAYGDQPAISSNGRFLAYEAGNSGDLAVRDLSSGQVRRIDLSALLGPSTDLLNATVTWLGDGSEIVILPGAEGIAGTGGTTTTTTQPSPKGSCSAVAPTSTCLIVVHVIAKGQTLTARRLVLPVFFSGFVTTMAGDAAFSRSLLFASLGAHQTLVNRVDFLGSGAQVVRLLTLPTVFPVAFDPAGKRFLYLVGHTPPALWIAGFTARHLVHTHRLIADARLGAAAW